MLRGRFARSRVGEEEGFSWRGEDVSRIEGLSDAVFAFAVTLLVVSLEVPKTFDELLATMRGFFAFAICFWLLLVVWFEQYKFFRRYGLSDSFTLHLNGILLYIVLFYVYPLKFLFTLVVDQLPGFSAVVDSSTGAIGEKIEPEQVPLLMVIYGAGFIAVQFIFFLPYLRAYVLRGVLGLNTYERSVTREEIQGFLLSMGVGLASIAIAVFGGKEAASSWAGYAYFLLFPLLMINGYLMSSHRRRSKASADGAGATQEEEGPREGS
ncbi:MAG: hypothetical protein QOI57_1868 [Rubrobacteraceae bacterium]|nr:hypothetical protein [Rubrobacteraceae bacterium]